MIKKVHNTQVSSSATKIIVEKPKIEIKEKIIEIEKHIIQASDSAKVTVL